MRALMGAIHAANGNKRGAKAAQKFRLTAPERGRVPLVDSVIRKFGADEADLITAEQIRARQIEMGLV